MNTPDNNTIVMRPHTIRNLEDVDEVDRIIHELIAETAAAMRAETIKAARPGHAVDAAAVAAVHKLTLRHGALCYASSIIQRMVESIRAQQAMARGANTEEPKGKQ